MDTLGPRIMVNVGTQAVSNTGLNPRDLAPLTNDAFLANFMGKPTLPVTNGISRQHNNYRQSYTTQTERATFRTKSRPSTVNGESIEPDSAILSIIRGNGSSNNQQPSSQRQLQGNRRRRRSFNQQQLISGWNDIPCSPNYRPATDLNRRRRTRSGGVQQQITVVDQMAAQPHIPYAILPKRFEPKQVPNHGVQQQLRSSNNNTNNNKNSHRHYRPAAPRRPQRQQTYYDDQWQDEDNDSWHQSNIRQRFDRPPNRSFGQTNSFRGYRQPTNKYYDSYSYGSVSRQGQVPLRSHRRTMYQDDGYIPFDIVPSYDLNEWQGPYARSRQSLNSKRHGAPRNGRTENGFIRDDHRVNNPTTKQSRNGTKPLTPTRNRKQTKSPNKKGQQKRRISRQRKVRNQNSKSEGQGTSSTNTDEVKSTTETETTNEDKPKEETTAVSTAATTENETQGKPLPPRDSENKESEGDKQIE